MKRITCLALALYSIYLFKTAVGIDLSKRYSAPQLFKIPLKAINHKIMPKGIYPHSYLLPLDPDSIG